MKKKRGIYLILAGLLILAIRIDIDTGISYGFVIGQGEGVASYAVTQIVTTYVGANLLIDIFFDPLGYGLVIAGFLLVKKDKIVITMASLGAAAYIGEILLPFVMNTEALVIPLIGLHLLQVVAIVAILFGLIRRYTAMIDNYKYMQVEKDLVFAAELYGTCAVIEKILYIFTRMDWYFSHVLYIGVSALAAISMAYYVLKALKYMRIPEMFEEKKVEEQYEK